MTLRPATSSRRRVRRRVAQGLVVYGIAGLALALASVLALARPLAVLETVASQRAGAARFLDVAVRSLDSAGRSSAGVAGSLTTAQRSARSASALFGELSATMAGLREASTFSILGAQPLAGLRDNFDRVAARSGAVADEMTGLATSLAADAVTVGDLASETGRLRDEVAAVRGGLVSGDLDLIARIRDLASLAMLAVAWLVVPAVVSLAVGVREIRANGRPRGPRSSDGRDGTAGLTRAS